MSRRGRSSSAFSLFAFQDIITSVTGIMILVTLTLALELLHRKEASPPRKTAETTTAMRTTIANNAIAIQEFKNRLEEGKRRMAAVAAYDPRRVRDQVKALRKLNGQLKAELDKFAGEREAAGQRQTEAEAEKRRRESEHQTIEQLFKEAEDKKEKLRKLKASKRVIFNPSGGDPKNPWLVEIDEKTLKVAKVGESAPPKIFRTVGEFRNWAGRRDRNSKYFVLLVKPAGILPFLRVRAVVEELRFDIGFDLLTAGQSAVDPETGAAP